MIRGSLLALLPVALSFNVPATAAEPQTLACIDEKMTPAFAEEFGKTNAQSSAEILVSGTDSRADKMAELYAELSERLSPCVNEHGWTDEAFGSALDYADTKLTLPHFQLLVGKAGIDPAEIARAYEQLTPAQRASFAATGAVDGNEQTFLEYLGRSLNEEQAALVSSYAVRLSQLEERLAEFARN